MSRYDWLKREIESIPRRKFHVLQQCSLSELVEIESCYGQLPSDYREFVERVGQANLFRSPHGRWYYLTVIVPPVVMIPQKSVKKRQGAAVPLKLGHDINTGAVWIECNGRGDLDEGRIYTGLAGGKPRAVGSFQEWFERSFTACRRLFSDEEWAAILTPVRPFDAKEQQVVDAIPLFSFRKVGVTPRGNVLIEVQNDSPLELPFLTIGTRTEHGMIGAAWVPVAGIKPGTCTTIEAELYRGSMDPHALGLFRLPVPEPEDRPYYRELLELTKGDSCASR